MIKKLYYILDENGRATDSSPAPFMDAIQLPECPDISLYKYVAGEWVVDSDLVLKEVRDLRAINYPPLGDMAGALYDYFLQKRLNGEELTEELNQWVSDCTNVKTDYPKPKPEEVVEDGTE